jgi:hypothetical protein
MATEHHRQQEYIDHEKTPVIKHHDTGSLQNTDLACFTLQTDTWLANKPACMTLPELPQAICAQVHIPRAQTI